MTTIYFVSLIPEIEYALEIRVFRHAAKRLVRKLADAGHDDYHVYAAEAVNVRLADDAEGVQP